MSGAENEPHDMDLDTLQMKSIGHSFGVGIRHLWTH